MRTTINSVDRRGDAYSIEHLEDVLIEARRILADTRAVLELEIEKLDDGDLDEKAEERLKNLKTTLGEARRSTTMVLELEAKLCVHALSLGPAIDLEAAREEILSRFARYVT